MINPCTHVKGVDSSQQDLPPNTIKGRCFSVNNLGTRKLLFARQNSSKGPNKHLPVFSPKMAVIHPNFPEENRGGGHTNLQIALPAKFLNLLE